MKTKRTYYYKVFGGGVDCIDRVIVDKKVTVVYWAYEKINGKWVEERSEKYFERYDTFKEYKDSINAVYEYKRLTKQQLFTELL